MGEAIARLTVSEFIDSCKVGFLTDETGVGKIVGTQTGFTYIVVNPSNAANSMISHWDHPGSFRVHWHPHQQLSTGG